MRHGWWLAPILAAFSIAGCGGGYAYYSNVPPPPARVEVYGAAPGPGYVWIPGYHAWRGGSYVWVNGYWGRPPRPRAVWVQGSWEPYHGRYRFRPGHWR